MQTLALRCFTTKSAPNSRWNNTCYSPFYLNIFIQLILKFNLNGADQDLPNFELYIPQGDPDSDVDHMVGV